MYTREWKCPKCGETIDWSYDDLAECGVPICDCETDMELQPEKK